MADKAKELTPEEIDSIVAENERLKQLEAENEQLKQVEAENAKLRAQINGPSKEAKVIEGSFAASWNVPGERAKQKGTFGFKDGIVMVHVPNSVVETDRMATRVYTEKLLKLHAGKALSEEERNDGNIHYFTDEDGKANENVEKLLVHLAERYVPNSRVLKKIK